MIGGESSFIHSSFSGSNALSHIYIQYPPLRCQVPGSKGSFYDDGNKLILSLTANQVFSWKTSPYNPNFTPSSDPVSDGPVLSMRYSLDLKLLAIQRSRHEIQIWNKVTGDIFSQKCRSESESILGFFWTDCPTCDIVFVKTGALEFYTYNTEGRFLHLVETKKMNISWYIYTHESRLVLLASGIQCQSFAGYQLSSAGIVRLPRFEMVMAKAEGNTRPILAAEDVHLITVYGRIYCLQFDRVAMALNLYRFYRDAVVQQGSLPAYSNGIAMSVVDNVLLVHQLETKVAILYDLFADSKAPVSAPLPLCLRGYSNTNLASSHNTSNDSVITIYGDQWKFLVPDLVCDVSNGFLWKINVDLEAISASSSEVSPIVEFLQRRKLEADKAKQLCLAVVRTIILERKPIPVVSSAIDVLLTAYTHAIKTGSYYKRIVAENTSSPVCFNPSSIVNEPVIRSASPNSDSDGSLTLCSDNPNPSYIGHTENLNDSLNPNGSERTCSAAISPADFYTSVFAIVEEEMAGDGSYMTTIIVEFLKSASLEKLKVHPNTYILMVQILTRDERYAELRLFIMNKIIEPSKEVALQLLESGRHNTEMRKLGLDMLRHLSFHHDYILLLVQDGYYIEALLYARKNKVNTVQPSVFLEAAHSSNNPQHVAAVLRFFCDFVPGFKSTSDHGTYYRLVAEMNS